MLDTKALAEATAAIVKSHVEAAVAPLLRRIDELEARHPERGEKGEPGARGEQGSSGDQGEPGRDGKDASPVSDQDIAAAVARYLDANPPLAGKDGATGEKGSDGRDGVDGTAGAAGRDGVDGRDGSPGEKGVDGRDGVGLAGAVIDRSGDLVVTLTNGEHKNLGPVLGKDGSDGRDGVDGLAGAAGQPGADGLGFDDFDLVEGERGLVLRFSRGALVKEFSLPVVVDRGVWREREYVKGNGVTWAGSFWIAQRDTTDKPETSDAWRLSVKRGRDGKDGKAA